MTVVNHDVIKPTKLLEVASHIIADDLVLSKMIDTIPAETFVGAEGDTVVYKRDGQLPYRTYDIRNDRANPIVVDKFFQVKIPVDFGTRIYSALDVTHEQAHLDAAEWARARMAQIRAVARGIEDKARGTIESAPYEVTIGGAGKALLSAVTEARRVLKRMRVRSSQMFLLCGTDFFAALNSDKQITFAQATGDARADTAFAEAQLGRLKGFTVVENVDIAPDAAYAFGREAFLGVFGAPKPSKSFTISEVISSPVPCRYTVGGDIKHLSDTEVIDTYAGVSAVVEPVFKQAGLATGQTPVVPDLSQLKKAFLRGCKLTLGGASAYPDKVAKKEIVEATGLTSEKAWNGDEEAKKK